ncbi:MAG: hypothetical protein U0938_04010, partial [Thiobacillus sp.]|nr:hypothetical protein [Thiobacillus sp.]
CGRGFSPDSEIRSRLKPLLQKNPATSSKPDCRCACGRGFSPDREIQSRLKPLLQKPGDLFKTGLPLCLWEGL